MLPKPKNDYFDENDTPSNLTNNGNLQQLFQLMIFSISIQKIHSFNLYCLFFLSADNKGSTSYSGKKSDSKFTGEQIYSDEDNEQSSPVSRYQTNNNFGRRPVLKPSQTEKPELLKSKEKRFEQRCRTLHSGR